MLNSAPPDFHRLGQSDDCSMLIWLICSPDILIHPRLSPQSVPFAGTILGGLLPGEMVVIQGSVLPDADR